MDVNYITSFFIRLKSLTKNIFTFTIFIFFNLFNPSFAYQETVISNRGAYSLTFSTKENVIPLRNMHSWNVTFKTKDGKEFIPGNLSISGGMPSHGHGLPSEPNFTRVLKDKSLLLEGVLFNMTGEWELRVTLTGPSGLDIATLEFTIDDADSGQNNNYELDRTLLSSMHISRIENVNDPTNKYLDNNYAIKLGERLFFDPNLSKSNSISCSTCHHPNLSFSDSRKKSFGTAETKRHSPTLLGVSHSKWFYWDGRRDSLWAQTLTPIETNGEMSNNRASVINYVLSNEEYKKYLFKIDNKLSEQKYNIPNNASPYGNQTEKENWEKLNTEDRNTINFLFSIIGKSIAAYISTLQHTPSEFDKMIEKLDENKDLKLNQSQLNGLKLFLDVNKTHCLRCHNGPLLTNHGFHNIGTGPDSNNNFDYGRLFGIQAVAYDVFNCRGQFSDAPDKCEHYVFAKKTNMPSTAAGAFKVPSLRNILATAPYMHDGRFETLKEIVQFYNDPPDPNITPHELPPLNLTNTEVDHLVEFLKIL